MENFLTTLSFSSSCGSIQFQTKYYKIHFNIDLFDYFLFVERIKMKLRNIMFPRLEISETNKFCQF